MRMASGWTRLRMRTGSLIEHLVLNGSELEAGMGNRDYEDLLKREFDAEEGSFLLKLRVYLEWDATRFDELVAAMDACCRDEAGSGTVDRWVASGFWYVPEFVADWVSHPSFPREHPQQYYDKRIMRLRNLAVAYFMDDMRSLEIA